MYELGKNKYILGRKPFLLGGVLFQVPAGCSHSLPWFLAALTSLASSHPPREARGRWKAEGSVLRWPRECVRSWVLGVPLGSPGVLWEPSEIWQGDT